MNYLAELLDHLDADELATVRALEVANREREVLEYLILHPLADRKAAIAALSISGSHFDKISSNLLARVYDVLAPGGVFAIFDFLKPKGMWAHLDHEFKKEEKRLKGSKALDDFYFDALRRLALYTYEKRYVEVVERCMTWLEQLRPTPSVRSIVASIRAQIVSHYMASTSVADGARDASTRALFDLHDAAYATGDPVAIHYQLNAEAHDHLMNNEGHEPAKILSIALEDIERQPELFLPSERARILAQLAEALYYDDQLVEAARRYEDLFTAKDQDITSPHYHAVKYAQIMLAYERFAEAEKIMRRWFPRVTMKPNDRRSAAGAINLAKLYVAWGKLEEAEEFIELGRECNIKAEVVPYEIQLRLFEILVQFSRGKYDLANDLMEKMIRYGREKTIISSASQLPPLIGAARILVRSKCELDIDISEFDRITLQQMPKHNRHAAVMLRRVRDRVESRKGPKTAMAA